jgi:TonB family protein
MPNAPMTKAARDAKFDGIVVAKATVTVKGKIENIKILKSPGLGLDNSVVKTLKSWKCSPPFASSGEPMAVTVSFQFRFPRE